MTDRLHLEPRHRKLLEALLRKHLPEVEAWAYGSRVNGRSHDGSDLDLILRGPDLKEIPISDLADFEEAVRDSTIPFLVEARDWARVPERFHPEIERRHIRLHGAARQTEGDSSSQTPWSTTTVDAISEKVAMGPFGSSIKVATFVPDGVPIISGQHLHGVRVDDTRDFNFITQEHAERLTNANVRCGDVIFTHRGNIGQVSYIPESSRFDHYVVSQSQFYMRCDRTKALPEFVAAYFSSPEGQHKLLANASQVGVPSIAQPVTYLRTIEVPLPSLAEQSAIAHILGTLDDKIELNRRTNQTLEAMARAIFKDWFVDFGPVKAKMEGRDPYLPPDIWKLFPDTLDSTGKPVGWTTYALGDLAHHHRATLSPCVQPDRTYEHYSIPAYDAGREPSSDRGGSIRSNKTIVPDGAVLLSKLNPEIERVWLPNPRSTAPQIASTELLTLTPSAPATRSVLYCLFGSAPFRAEMTARVTGTSRSHQRVPPRALLACHVLAADPMLLGLFDNNVGPMLDRTISHRRESSLLEQARDLLLPKLLSGAIRTEATELAAGRKPVGHQTAQADRSWEPSP